MAMNPVQDYDYYFQWAQVAKTIIWL